MRKPAFVFAALSIVCGLAGAAPCRAQLISNLHSYVAATGSGTACTLTSPCADLATAVNATRANGEVSCLDGGSKLLNSLSITRSVTIDCVGVPAGTGSITINGSNIVVTLRNLKLSTFGATINNPGVDFQNGAALFVENCVIEHWDGTNPVGINFAPTAGSAKLYVTDSIIKNNGTASAGGGIFIRPASGAEADVTIERSKVENNVFGIDANSGSGGTVHGVVRDSVVSGNTKSGILARNAGTRLLIENTTVTGNNAGLVATTSANMLVSRSSVVLNRSGLVTASGATLASYNNNNVNNNTVADGAFTTAVAQK